jgi:hypothetical protein
VGEGERDENVKICSKEGEMVMGGNSSSSSSNASNSCASSYVEDVLAQHPAMFGKVLANAPRFRFQVLLSHLVVDPHAPAPPRLVRHGYRVDKEYFYPARCNFTSLLFAFCFVFVFRNLLIVDA